MGNLFAAILELATLYQITYCLTQSAPLQRNQNFNSLTLSDSGLWSPKEAPGISTSVRLFAINLQLKLLLF